MPITELVVIIQVGQALGAGLTILLMVATSLLGVSLMRREGRRAWQELRVATQQGRWPGPEAGRGGLVVLGGFLLLAPGFVTDVIGLLLLLPPTRMLMARLIGARVATGGRARDPATSRRRVGTSGAGSGTGSGQHDGAQVLDVEVVDVQRDEPPNPQGGTRAE